MLHCASARDDASVVGVRTDASRGAAQAEYVAQRIAHEHRLADRLWVVVAARVEDGEEDGVNDGKGDADALVQARVVGLGQVLWRARRRASHGGVCMCWVRVSSSTD